MRKPTALAAAAATTAVIVLSWNAGTRTGHLPSVGPAVAAPVVPGGTSATSRPAPAPAPGARGAPAPAPGAPAAGGPRQVDGTVARTPYGLVQVRVDLVGTHIQDVIALRLTDSTGTSVRISASAAPVLRREAVAAQSARIDAVSGATYTSDGYRQSLQAALDAAHV